MKYNVTRSTSIEAESSKVLSLIENFNHWNKWSPWNIAEPDCEMKIDGEPGKPGHKMSWDGKIIGSGHQTLTSHENGVLKYELVFLAPWKSKATTSLTVKGMGARTEVTWTMDSSMPFYLFFMTAMMKAMIGMDYDRGLRMLKEIAEKGTVDAETKSNGVQNFEGFSYVGIKRRVPISQLKEMSKDFEKLKDDLQKRGKKARHWVTVYPKFHAKANEMTYIAAASDEELKDLDFGSEYVKGEIVSGPALEITHRGSYDFLGNAWSMGMMYVFAKKMKQRKYPFEYYRNNPHETPENELKTSVFFPIKEKR